MKKNLFLVKNFFNYEKIIPPPENIPNNMVCCYLTDSFENKEIAISLGWNFSVVNDKYRNIDNLEYKRFVCGHVNSKPHEFVSEVFDFNFTFVSDSNIVRLWDGYENFIDKCTSENALFFTSGYYPKEIDNLHEEIIRSKQRRWEYNYENMKKYTNEYIEELSNLDVDINNLSICSAKYFGWNPHHEKFEFFSNLMYNEHKKHLQGNIIQTYLLGKYPSYIYNHNNISYIGGILNIHNYEG